MTLIIQNHKSKFRAVNKQMKYLFQFNSSEFSNQECLF